MQRLQTAASVDNLEIITDMTTQNSMLSISHLYPAYQEGTIFHFRPDGAHTGTKDSVHAFPNFFPVKDMLAQNDSSFSMSKFINHSASAIAWRMRGEKTVQEIVGEVADEMHEQSADIVPMIETFIRREELENRVVLTAEPRPVSYRITGSREYFHPTHITLELTYQCNCRCRHCYINAAQCSATGISEPRHSKSLTADQFIAILDMTADHGASVVELTGGEPLLHPGFWRILEHACKRSEVTALLSNGMLIDEKAVARLKEAAVSAVSISLDGPDAETHDYFRNCAGSHKAATKAISLLSKASIITRVAMSVWPGNYQFVEDTINLARSLGANSFALSPVQGAGRGTQGVNLKMTKTEEAAMWATVHKCIERYGADFMAAERLSDPRRDMVRYVGNCGVLSRSVVVNPYGEVRPCQMSPAGLTFGNLLDMGYDAMFSRDLSMPGLPNAGGSECKNCPAIYTCKPCVIKAMRAYSRMRAHGFDICNWGKVHGVRKILEKHGWDYSSFLDVSSQAHTNCAPVSLNL